MTDPARPDEFAPDDSDDLIAAEYVLGTLSRTERRAAQNRMDVDGGFAARVRAWESRFAALNDGYQDAAVPDLLPQIEARLFAHPVSTSPKSLRGRWFGFGALAGTVFTALVLALAILLGPVIRPTTAPLNLQASLVAEPQALSFAARWNSASNELVLTRVAGEPAPVGQDYEVWLIDASGVPRSLGLIQGESLQVAADLAPGLTLAISLEPEGGSPNPVPSGPVLAAAALTEG
jgi:anti-sigma-K factor RskA